MNFARIAPLLSLTLALAGCATPASQMTNLSTGMSKGQVVAVMGQPNSTSVQGGTEYLSYVTCIADCWRIPPYRVMGNVYVRLRAGLVESWGNKGDFDSTKTPTVRVEKDEKVEVVNKAKPDLYTELKKLKDLLDTGVITQAEFEDQKKRLLAQQ